MLERTLWKSIDQVGDLGGWNCLAQFKFNTVLSQMIEEPETFTEQHRHQLNVQFVDCSCANQRLSDFPAHHGDILVLGRSPSLLDGAHQTIGNEGEGAVRCGQHVLVAMRDDKSRYRVGSLLTPYAEADVEKALEVVGKIG